MLPLESDVQLHWIKQWVLHQIVQLLSHDIVAVVVAVVEIVMVHHLLYIHFEIKKEKRRNYIGHVRDS